MLRIVDFDCTSTAHKGTLKLPQTNNRSLHSAKAEFNRRSPAPSGNSKTQYYKNAALMSDQEK
tara:strand:+ start:163603 stop:163791 length:189 start_codon:yes stop_codon:yes gene_type:complete